MKHKSKLKQCKSCGAEIAKSAKNCPQCGAKNKKPVYKRVWFILLCIIAVFIIIGALSGNDEKAKSDTTGNKQVEEETIEYKKCDIGTMDKDLENNAASAKDKYEEQYIEITGKLSVIDSDGKYISLTDPDDEWDLVGIMCYIESDEQLDKVKELSTGDDVTVGGKVTNVGEIIGYSIDIDYIK